MVGYSKKDATTKELLKIKIEEEKLKELYKETEDIDNTYLKEFWAQDTKTDRHPISYINTQKVEEWWRSAPLRLNLEESLSTFWWFASAYAVFWCSIGLWFAIKLLTA